jgi:hypothetical protein
LFLSCKKEDNKLQHAEGYIVGFDPCTIRHHYDIGYVIFTTDLKDTLVTYNFPKNIFEFPDEYFINYMNSAYFPQSARYEFKVKISYTKATGNEKVIHECLTDFNYSDFFEQIVNNQIIIKSATKY